MIIFHCALLPCNANAWGVLFRWSLVLLLCQRIISGSSPKRVVSLIRGWSLELWDERLGTSLAHYISPSSQIFYRGIHLTSSIHFVGVGWASFLPPFPIYRYTVNTIYNSLSLEIQMVHTYEPCIQRGYLGLIACYKYLHWY